MSSIATDLVESQQADDFDTRLAELLGKLEKLWKRHHKSTLDVRHETGRELNLLYGPPSQRQAYGEGTLKQVAERLGVSRSELSRMRKFAEAIPDLDDFRRDVPDCRTWTQVKQHLATLRTSGEPAPDKASTTSPFTGLRRAISALTKRIQQAPQPADDDRQKLMAAFQELAQAVRVALGDALQIAPDHDSQLGTPHEEAAHVAA